MFTKVSIFITACLLPVLVMAHDSHENKQVITYCSDPRPQICTMDYTPVCGLVDKKEVKTYGNACGACGDVKVTAHVPKECQTDSYKQFNLSKPQGKNNN